MNVVLRVEVAGLDPNLSFVLRVEVVLSQSLIFVLMEGLDQSLNFVLMEGLDQSLNFVLMEGDMEGEILVRIGNTTQFF
jgi:hypothetical protein